jgi:hypothetical protein
MQNGRLRAFVVVTVNLLVSLTMFEGVAVVLLNHPRLLQRYFGTTILGAFRLHYMYGDRGIIQCEPECAVYDKDLLYTLRPGSCVFNTREFSSRYFVNREGFRDSEEAVKHPEIAVLGDSFAMGWGVQQDETYAHLLAQGLGKRTINLGVSSYGTVRELLTLKRIDISNLKLIVLQYSYNDFDENEAFARNGNDYTPSSKEKYLELCRGENPASRGYYPFKHALGIYRPLLSGIRQLLFDEESISRTSGGDLGRKDAEKDIPKDVAYRKEAASLLNAIVHLMPRELQRIPIVMFEAGGWGQYRPEFLQAVEAQLAADASLPTFLKEHLIALDLSKTLSPEDNYVLDEHYNKGGHEKIAEELDRLIRERQLLSYGRSRLGPG